MTYEQRQNYITTAFILLSLLLHLLLLLIPKERLLPAEISPAPVFVEVRPSQPRERELDIPIREELEKPREKPAKRLAEKDQVVEKEQAPPGKDTEDREKVVRALPQPPKPAPRATPQPDKSIAKRPEQPAPELPTTPEGWKEPTAKPAPKLPDLETLTQISPNTLAKIESDWRRKYREDVEKGDTVWMDTEQDLLISFMRRFRDYIYGVWNYPATAVRQRQEGTCLVRVTIDRSGKVKDLQLLESSGYRVLDDEVLRAIRQNATYGPLPSAYPNEDLKIMAFFQYYLSGSVQRYRRQIY